MTISKTNSVITPNFKRIYQYANEILVCSSKIDGFPFKAKELVKEQTDIAFCTFEKASNKYHLPDLNNRGKFKKFYPGGKRK